MESVGEQVYQCYYCKESFSGEAALEHFGDRPQQSAACTIDTAEYRRLESLLQQYQLEDTDLHQEIARLRCTLSREVSRAEEAGYARGLRDAKAHPETLGLCFASESQDQSM